MSNRPFLGARLEESFHRKLVGLLRRMGWKESIIPYTGYGTDDQVRVLARVVLRPAEATSNLGKAAEEFLGQRGWRNFLLAPVPRCPVDVTIGDSHVQLRADRGGYIDVRLKSSALDPGWREVDITPRNADPVPVPVQVISANQDLGLVSDIDDTIISTSLPRQLIAAWNTLVLTEQARQSVPGMARMYQKLLAEHPGAPIIYVSTGAWNTYPFLSRFMNRHGYPRGAMLLTDWGPTNAGWFRSGPEHKRQALRELARDFPNIRWLLVGDDGQHDPSLYAEFAELQPQHTRLIAIRQLSMAEQVLAHGTTTVMEDRDKVEWTPQLTPEVRASDGDELAPKVRESLERTAE